MDNKDQVSTPDTETSVNTQPGQKRCGLAIAAFVLSLFSPITLGLSAIPGLILGILAIRRIRHSKGTLKSHGWAVAGTAISSIAIVIALLAGSILLHDEVIGGRVNNLITTGDNLVAKGNIKEALSVYLKAGKMRPYSALEPVTKLLGKNPSLSKSKEVADFASKVTQVVNAEANPIYIGDGPVLYLAELQFYNGNYNAIIQIRKKFPGMKGNPKGLAIIGETYLKMNKTDEAIDAYSNAIMMKEDPELSQRFAEILLATDYAEAAYDNVSDAVKKLYQEAPPIVLRVKTSSTPKLIVRLGASIPAATNVTSYVLPRSDRGNISMILDAALAKERLGKTTDAAILYTEAWARARWEHDVASVYSNAERETYARAGQYIFIPKVTNTEKVAIAGLRRLGISTSVLNEKELVAGVWKQVASGGWTFGRIPGTDTAKVTPVGW